MNNFNKERIIFIACSLIFFIANLDSTIVSSVLPIIAKAYKVKVLSLNVLIIFFMVAYALSILFVDFLVAIYGVKTVFLVACTIFAISSLGCGLVNSMGGLIIMRTIQGISAGFFTPIARSITVKISSQDKLAINLSNVQMLGMIGQVIGPVIGSLLTIYLNWKYIFFINVPLCIIVFITILYTLNKNIEDKKEANNFDYRGFVYIATIIIISVPYSSLSIGSDFFISNYHVISILTFVFTTCCVLLYKHIINYQKKLIIDFPLFKQNKLFKIYSLVSFISRQCTGAIYFIILMIFSLIYHLSTIKLSYLLLMYGLGIWISKIFMNFWLKKISVDKLMSMNLSGLIWLMPCGTFIMIFSKVMFLQLLFIFLLGIVVSIHHSCINILTFSCINKQDSMSASSITSLIMYLTQSTSVTIFSILFYFLNSVTSKSLAILYASCTLSVFLLVVHFILGFSKTSSTIELSVIK